MTWEQVGAAAVQCCGTLWRAGFEAYPVGGCVRDLLLGRKPGDWDVTTNATPEQVSALFDRVIATGVKHGTVTVILGEEHLEVTTFRGESGYSDGRHPDQVQFVSSLEEDLSRRDFTVNAMALAPDGTIIDHFGGQADLSRKMIRCVGRPEQRFCEDGLRMFRAVRFAAQLGFELTPDTLQAIRACAGGASRIAAERIRVELEKTLQSPKAGEAHRFFELGLMDGMVRNVPRTLAELENLPAEPMLRWAGLCGILLRDNCVEQAAEFLRSLRMERRLINACECAQGLLRTGVPDNETGWRKALAQYGADGCRCAAAMAQVCGQDGVLEALEHVVAQAPCVSVEGLAISGGELYAMGLRGMEIGAAQRYLLEHVMNHPQDNSAQVLGLKLKEFIQG